MCRREREVESTATKIVQKSLYRPPKEELPAWMRDAMREVVREEVARRLGDTPRMGESWTPEEDMSLKDTFARFCAEQAAYAGRSPSAISSRIKLLLAGEREG